MIREIPKTVKHPWPGRISRGAVFWVGEEKMATTHLSPEQLKELEQNVQQTLMKFPEEVVRIRYSFDQDWYGDPAINFRIVLSDRATRDDRFAQVLRRVRDSLDEMELAKSEFHPFFYFRSKSEEDRLKDPEWE